jgi:hypothetical protein
LEETLSIGHFGSLFGGAQMMIFRTYRRNGSLRARRIPRGV